jgi:hypothetical protein
MNTPGHVAQFVSWVLGLPSTTSSSLQVGTEMVLNVNRRVSFSPCLKTQRGDAPTSPRPPIPCQEGGETNSRTSYSP